MNPIQLILVAAVKGYQRVISPLLTALLGPLGFGCRFQPTCSHYALQALRHHGCIRGGWMALRRLGRCHPWGDEGYDPVPPPPEAKLPRHSSQPRQTGCTAHKV